MKLKLQEVMSASNMLKVSSSFITFHCRDGLRLGFLQMDEMKAVKHPSWDSLGANWRTTAEPLLSLIVNRRILSHPAAKNLSTHVKEQVC